MTAIVTAGAGFLIAVLWFDLMFDVQGAGQRDGDLPEATLASIAGYYARVTTGAKPMGLLVAVVMLVTLGAIVAQLIDGDAPAWALWASLILAGSAVGVAATRTFPSAVRLGARRDAAAEQTRLARSIRRQHMTCLAAMIALLGIQLGFVA